MTVVIVKAVLSVFVIAVSLCWSEAGVVTIEPSLAYIAEGGNVVFTCQTTTPGDTNLQWLRPEDGDVSTLVLLSDSEDDIEILTDASSSILTITDVDLERDGGQYICQDSEGGVFTADLNVYYSAWALLTEAYITCKDSAWALQQASYLGYHFTEEDPEYTAFKNVLDKENPNCAKPSTSTSTAPYKTTRLFLISWLVVVVWQTVL